MKNVQILDCTLRDGGYVVDGIFGENTIKDIINKLCKAKIDVIEVGFLKNVEYKLGSSTYNTIEQLKKFIPNDKYNTDFVAMIDFGRFDINKLPNNDYCSLKAIRNCFFKKDWHASFEASQKILDKGYELFIQPVDILGYTDAELLELIEKSNKLNPYAFSIVDTFGSMYTEDLERIFSLLNHNLNKNIKIGFHSHNNLQLSFALSQRIMQLANNTREIIIDSTLCGMGRGAGNTNTELLVNYLNKKYNYDYDINEILDLIDMRITPIMQDRKWGYSIPYLIAGMYSSHVHNITYLLDKHKVRSKDMEIIIGSLNTDLKKRYEYDNLEKVYISYFSNEIDDNKSLTQLADIMHKKDILILAPGKTLIQFKDKINKFIASKEDLIVISINHVNETFKSDFAFFSNNMRLDSAYHKLLNNKNIKTIITSNIKTNHYDFIVNYNKLITKGYRHFDNATILLLKLLANIKCNQIYIAGFDGYNINETNSYYDKSLQTNMNDEEKVMLNKEIADMLNELINRKTKTIDLEYLTPSLLQNFIVKQ